MLRMNKSVLLLAGWVDGWANRRMALHGWMNGWMIMERHIHRYHTDIRGGAMRWFSTSSL